MSIEVKIESSWKKVMQPEFDQPYFQEIRQHLIKAKEQGKKIFPPGPLIFNAFDSTPFDNVKVVILGQDPYHNPGEAMGLSFSVPRGVKIPPSLRNIFKELHKDLGVPLSTHGDLSNWAAQGVFLLNAILTVEANQPASHSKIGWQRFTDAVIRTISDQKSNVVFMLWGRFAQQKSALIDDSKHLILHSAHPSPLAGNAFFDNNHFSKANFYLSSHGLQIINWNIDE